MKSFLRGFFSTLRVLEKSGQLLIERESPVGKTDAELALSFVRLSLLVDFIVIELESS